MNRNVTYGIHAVRVLLSHHPQRVRRLLLAAARDDRRLGELRALAERAGIAITTADEAQLGELATGGRHQGAVAETVAPAGDPETALETAIEAGGAAPLLLALDGVQDPHNLGACLRSADAAGAQAVIAPRDRSASLTPVARKVAAGAAESVPFIAVVNVARALRELRERGFRVIGADGSARISLYEADLRGPLVVVLGSEGAGLRRLTRECCDELVAIPMAGAVESLNVSVATGVMLFEAVRQRAQSASGAMPDSL
jgi:23S rRNA (guanosine2251-2'-O)-methyltransferase